MQAEWGSRIGFIFAATGSAVGLGAIWKFPYVVAQNGGGAFLLVYLAIVCTLGITLMIAEITLGSVTRKGPVGTYRQLGNKKWVSMGYMGVLCGFLILSFYSVVGGWTIAYIGKALTGELQTSSPAELSTIFSTFTSSTITPILFHGLFMAFTASVVIIGVKKGIETISKYLMGILFLLILVFIIRGLTLDGAMVGLAAFLVPDFSMVSPSMIIEALGLAFFSLSIGMGCMVTYGSYIPSKIHIPTSAANIVALTTIVCFLSGLMVFPAIFAFGFNPAAGPGLTFITMPAIFSQMPAGQVFSVLFFFLLFVAALTSSVSLLEVVVNFFIDETKFTRTAATISMSFVMFIIGIFASLSLGVGKSYTLFGKNFFDILDYISSNLMMPFGGVMVTLFIGWKTWGPFKERLKFADGTYPKWLPILKVFYRFIAPAMIFLVLLQNL